jgi:hypothetical protein
LQRHTQRSSTSQGGHVPEDALVYICGVVRTQVMLPELKQVCVALDSGWGRLMRQLHFGIDEA